MIRQGGEHFKRYGFLCLSTFDITEVVKGLWVGEYIILLDAMENCDCFILNIKFGITIRVVCLKCKYF